jgi:hypothetical protein
VVDWTRQEKRGEGVVGLAKIRREETRVGSGHNRVWVSGVGSILGFH